jgi:hypothetical protein
MNGYTPPAGRRDQIERATGGAQPHDYTKDPGFQPPFDPLTDQSRDKVEQRAGIVFRDIPNITIQNTWSAESVRAALYQSMWGYFYNSGQLIDSMLGDDRVQATLGSRIGGLFARELIVEPANDSAAAKECCIAWEPSAVDLCGGYALAESAAYATMQGFAHGQIVWDTTGKVWRPEARPWHPMFEYFDWTTRKYIAISQDGNKAVIPGDCKWYGHLPFGSYRAWVRAAMRAVAEPWVIRHFAVRDWAGFSEIHGFPQRIGKVPAASEPGQRSAFEGSLANMGSNTAMIIPTGVDGESIGYGYELVEAQATAWESFPGLRADCDLAIVLAIKFQNLTTQITSGGSLAASQTHEKGDISQVSADNKAWKRTIHHDFARPFAFLNFGDADLAPITRWDVPDPPREDHAANAEAFSKFSTSMQGLATGGVKFKDPNEVRQWAGKMFGLREMPAFEIAEPPAVTTAKASASTAEATHKTADAAVKKADQPPPAPAPGGGNGRP